MEAVRLQDHSLGDFRIYAGTPTLAELLALSGNSGDYGSGWESFRLEERHRRIWAFYQESINACSRRIPLPGRVGSHFEQLMKPRQRGGGPSLHTVNRHKDLIYAAGAASLVSLEWANHVGEMVNFQVALEDQDTLLKLIAGHRLPHALHGQTLREAAMTGLVQRWVPLWYLVQLTSWKLLTAVEGSGTTAPRLPPRWKQGLQANMHRLKSLGRDPAVLDIVQRAIHQVEKRTVCSCQFPARHRLDKLGVKPGYYEIPKAATEGHLVFPQCHRRGAPSKPSSAPSLRSLLLVTAGEFAAFGQTLHARGQLRPGEMVLAWSFFSPPTTGLWTVHLPGEKKLMSRARAKRQACRL